MNYRTQGIKAFGNDMFNLVHSPIRKFIAVEKGENYKIILPPALMALYNTIFQLSLDINTENLPYLEIAIALEDIIGNPYQFDYKFILESSNVNSSYNTNGKLVDVKAILDIKENKETNLFS